MSFAWAKDLQARALFHQGGQMQQPLTSGLSRCKSRASLLALCCEAHCLAYCQHLHVLVKAIASVLSCLESCKKIAQSTNIKLSHCAADSKVRRPHRCSGRCGTKYDAPIHACMLSTVCNTKVFLATKHLYSSQVVKKISLVCRDTLHTQSS